jgi:hypothetical protein
LLLQVFPKEKMRGTSILLLNLFTTDAFNKAFIVKLGELFDIVDQAIQSFRHKILRAPCSSSLWFPRNLSNHWDWQRQAHKGDTVLVRSREMTGWNQTHPWREGGKRGKDD